MNISVIITTYNQPRWLNLVLLGYVCQEDQDFEIVVADDGSDERTAAVIAQCYFKQSYSGCEERLFNIY